MKNKIYLDHSATTPVDKKVLEKMLPYFDNIYGNASSIHTFGQEAAAGVDKARQQVANFLHCQTDEIYFTSGATESNNIAIKGLISALKKKGIQKPHVITSIVEHDAVLEPLMELQANRVEVTHLGVGKNGVIDLEELKNSIQDNTVLVSVMYVNSEVGAVMPIREIGKIIHKYNENKLKDWKNANPKERGEAPTPIYFHTDATQAVNFFNCDVEWNYIDMLSMSAHKIYGPKGVGALYRKNGVPLLPLQRGGHQEKNLRSGTLNVSGIVGLGAAIELLGEVPEKGEISLEQKNNNEKIAAVRNLLVLEIEKNIPDAILNTDRKNSTPAHAHFSFLGVEGESALISLDLEGIAVSTGSACASGSLKASHVLIAMGIDKEVAHYSIRFTLGKHTTAEDIKITVEKLKEIVERLRKMNPIYRKA